MPQPRVLESSLFQRAVLCFAISAVLFGAVPLFFGSPQRAIEIEWRSQDPATRTGMERSLGLTDPTRIDDRRWRYVPAETSPEALKRISTSEAIAGITGIDRRQLTLTRSTPLTERRGGLIAGAPPWLARGTRVLAAVLAAMGALLVAVAVLRSPRFSTHPEDRRWSTWLARGIPDASPAAAGFFRVVFGTAVVLFVAAQPFDAGLLESPAVVTARGVQGAVVQWLASYPDRLGMLRLWLLVTGMLFTIGLLTPLTFAGFVVGFFVWACVFTLGTTTHAVAVLTLTLLALLAARWSDAVSVDAWLRRRRAVAPASAKSYGYAIWVPRFVLGLAFLAAAWSKVSGGPDWILNGTVKYHFVTDLDHALVTWGPWLTRTHGAAVAMSAYAVAVEALTLTAAFSRSSSYVLLAGAAALSLLVGFAVFQGVFWFGWWLLLIAFLPWHRIAGSASADSARLAVPRPVQIAVAVTLAVQQVAASAGPIEASPMLSAYDMYSASYDSIDDYEASANLVYRVVIVDEGSRRQIPECTIDERMGAVVASPATATETDRAYIRATLAECQVDVPDGASLILEGERRVYDWGAGTFTWHRTVDTVGPVPADWLR